MNANQSRGRPPLVVLTSSLYWCLGIGAGAFAVMLLIMREKIAEIFRDFGTDPAAASAAPATDDIAQTMSSLANMSQFFAILCGVMGLIAIISLIGATFFFLRRQAGLNVLLVLTWCLAAPMLFVCLWAIASRGAGAILMLVQCLPFAAMLVLLYSKPVQRFCSPMPAAG